MSFFPHVVVGAAVGSFTGNSVLGFLAGVVSHFVLDFIPHWDPVVYGVLPTKRLVKWLYGFLLFLDILLSLIVMSVIVRFSPMLWGAIGGAIVDIDNFAQYFFKGHTPILYRYLKIDAHQKGSRWHKMTNIYLGLFNQGWVTAVGLLVLLVKLRIFNF